MLQIFISLQNLLPSRLFFGFSGDLAGATKLLSIKVLLPPSATPGRSVKPPARSLTPFSKLLNLCCGY